MDFNDAVTLDCASTRKTADGYLAAVAKIARTGIQVYGGAEVGRPDLAQVRVFRPESEVFAADTLRSAAWRPMTNDHPAQAVTADSWKKVAIGQTGDEVARDGDFIRVPLVLMDAAAIKDWEAGKRELSAGYTCDLKWESGTAPDGQAYDAIQTHIRLNHLALVGAGRAGPHCRIGDDNAPQPKGDRPMALKTIIVDGLPVETTDAGEAAINKLRGMLDTSAKTLETADAAHKAAVAAHATELAAKDAEIRKLTDAALSDAQLDALVTDRADTMANAKLIDAKVEVAGKSVADIKRAAVVAKLGDAAAKDKDDTYIAATFDHLLRDAKPDDSLRGVITNGAQVIGDAAAAADAAWKAAGDDLNGWRTKAA